MKIATWNVNSIRARITNFMDWIKIDDPDLVLLQELKCTEEQFPFFEFETLGYNINVVGQKGRNGVAIFSKYRMFDISKSLPTYNIVDEDDTARYIEAYIDYNGKVIKIISVYVPNGSPTVEETRQGVDDLTKTDTFYNKMKFIDRLKIKMKETIKNNEIAFFCGDYNICPNLYIDVYTPKKDGVISCTQNERDKFQELLDVGMNDIWRTMNPDLHEYSWWGYRPYQMFEKNQGYRLDAILTTPEATKLVKSCYINKKIRAQTTPSDHAPMICEI